MNWTIKFRRLENKTNIHIKAIYKLKPDFCSFYPYFINVNLGKDVRVLLCDGKNIIDVSDWSGSGLSLSKEVDPTEEVKNIVNEFVFKA